MEDKAGFLERLTSTRSLWLLFIATVLITLCFPVISSIWGIVFIDAISSPEEVRMVIADMTQEQRVVHAWTTATVDVAYPLAYGFYFAATTLKFFPQYGKYLAVLPRLAIPVDICEGIVQVMALMDVADFIGAKAILTPVKSILFLAGFFFSVAAWFKWVYGKVMSR